MIKDKSRIQSCIDHINTAIDVDPWAKKLVAEMGKEMLKAQLSKEDATSDCISRQAAIDICNNTIDLWQGQLGEGALVAIKNAINNLPSVQPERKTGKWIRWHETKEDETGTEYIPHCRCSECGTEYDPHSSKFVSFCNVCGAKMEEGE